MSTTPDKLVERYLKNLDVELVGLPHDRRREIVDEIAGHIGEARAGLGHETEADVRNILDELGDPAEIAEDARERFEIEPPPPIERFRSGWLEIAALILLLIGGLVIPFIGWAIGVVLLWMSNAWNVRDKIIGTVFVPGGLGLAVLLMSFGSKGSGSGLCSVDPATGREFDCTESASATTLSDVLAYVLVFGALAAPIIATAYLAYRLRRQVVAARA